MSIPLPLIREIEMRYLHAWPAQMSKTINGWTTCVSGGWTNRANCVVPISPTASFSSLRCQLEELAKEQGVDCTIRISPLAPPSTDYECEKAGYSANSPGLVMTADILTQFPVGGRKILLEQTPTNGWKKGYAFHAGLTKSQVVQHNALLDRISLPSAFVSILDDSGTRIAFGYGTIEKSMVGIFDVLVAERYRSQGLARQVTVAILNWARDMGCRTAYLMVNEDNAVARAVYQRYGFTEAYRYHYRKKAMR